MGGPAWLADTFAAMMLVIAAYCALRLAAAAARRRETELDADCLHLVMGVAMAGMLVPGLRFAPTTSWAEMFALAAVWFGWQKVRVWRGLGTGPWTCPYPVPHLAESLAMVYMLVAARGAGSGTGMAGMGAARASSAARLPELAVIFALFMVGYVAWLGDRFSSVGATAASPATASPVTASPVTAGPAAGSPVSAAAAASAGTAAEAAPATAEAAPATATATIQASMAGTAQAGGCWPVLAPRGACCYKIVMAIVMGYMLIVML